MRDDLPVPVTQQMAYLPQRLRQALERELCPGEKVEWIIPPRRARYGILRLGAICGLGAIAATIGGAYAGSALLYFAALVALLGAFSLFDASLRMALVLTNERCFRLRAFGWKVHVRDITALPPGLALRVEDLTRLRNSLWALERERRTGKGRRAVEGARIARNVPPALLGAVKSALMPGEQLRWAERPSPKSYLANAPLDLLTTFGFVGGFGLTFVSVMMMTSGVADDGHAEPIALGLAMLLAAAANLWRQVRKTVYAVTDRRGLVVGPGGRLRIYEPNQLIRFQRTQDATGRGTLAPAGSNGDGFYGLQNAKYVDDLIKQRTPRDASTELAPAEALPGRGDELGAA